MSMRVMASVGIVSGVVAFVATSSVPLQGQGTRSAPPPLVITATGGKPVDYKAPRTPWGDPDLQGVWSSDDMENVPMAAGRGGRGGRGGPGAPPPVAAPAGPP